MSKSLGNVIAPQTVMRAERRRHPAPVGGRLRLHRGSAHRPGDPEAPRRRLSPAAQHAALSAGRLDGYSATPRRSRLRDDARARALGAAPPGRARRAGPASGRGLRLPRDRPPRCTISAPSICRPSISTSARTRLYCDAPDDPCAGARRAPCSTDCFDCLARWLAPGHCASPPRRPGSPGHGDARGDGERPSRASFPRSRPPGATRRSASAGTICASCAASSPARSSSSGREKRIGSSLQAAPRIHAAPEYLAAFKGLDLCEISITSDSELVEGQGPEGAFTLPDVAGVAVEPLPAHGNKCARCWQVLEEVGKSARHPMLCRRCEAAVTA